MSSSISQMSVEIRLMNINDVGKKKGLDVWRVNNFELEEVPKEEHGVFYSGDCYVLLNTKSLDQWDIHFWLGKNCSGDERGVAAIMAVHIDNALGGFPVEYREVQGHESSLFLSYFPDGIRYMEGGYESGYRHVEDMFVNWKPQLFHCKGKRNIRCFQVDCKKESLNMGDVFILDLGRNIYVWMPPKSGRLERIKAMSRAKNMAQVERQGESKVHIIDEEWKTHGLFWSYFGGKESIGWIKGAKDDDEDFWKENNMITLWRVSDSTGQMKINQIDSGNLHTKMLDSKDAFILDAGKGGVYVWIGKNCTSDEREKAMETGAKYLNQRKLPDFTNLTRVLETAEPNSFTQWFGDWEQKKSKRNYEPRLYQVSDETGKLVTEEIEQYDQMCLDGDDVMILDTMNLTYVWVGADANKNERDSAEQIAQKFLKESQLPRGKTPKIEVIFQGQEPPTFKKFFPEWDEKLFKNNVRSVANMRKILFNVCVEGCPADQIKDRKKASGETLVPFESALFLRAAGAGGRPSGDGLGSGEEGALTAGTGREQTRLTSPGATEAGDFLPDRSLPQIVLQIERRLVLPSFPLPPSHVALSPGASAGGCHGIPPAVLPVNTLPCLAPSSPLWVTFLGTGSILPDLCQNIQFSDLSIPSGPPLMNQKMAPCILVFPWPSPRSPLPQLVPLLIRSFQMDFSPSQLLAMYVSNLPWNLFLTSTALHAIALITSPLQAVYKWWRRQSSDSDTCVPYICAVIGSSLWWRYSVFLHDTKLILLQSYALFMQCFFLVSLLYYRSKKRRLTRLVSVIILALLALFYYVGNLSEEDGKELMGQMASTAQIAGSFVCPWLIYKAVTSRCIDFVPMAPVAFTWVMEIHAIIYSVGIDDFYMMLANTIFFCMDGSLLSMFFIFPREKPEKSNVLVQ